MPNIKVMDMTGNEVSNIELSDAIFGPKNGIVTIVDCVKKA